MSLLPSWYGILFRRYWGHRHADTVIMQHPGYVNTNLVAGIRMPPETVQPEEAAQKLWEVLQDKGVKAENTAKFWHREGYELPW